MQIKLNFSKFLAVLLCMLYIGAAACVLWVPLYGWLKIGVLVLLVWCFLKSWQRYIMLQGSKAIVALAVKYNEWQLRNAGDQFFMAQLHSGSMVTRYFLLLSFMRIDNKKMVYVPIFIDALGGEDFRRLRKYLLMKK